MHYKKVIVYTFCQLILASVDNCNWIFISQIYIEWQNESNSIYILSINFAGFIITSGFSLHSCIDGKFTRIPTITAIFNILFIS